MCRLFAVSRSGFYRWNQGGESKRAAENRLLLNHIQRIVESTRGRYGSPRITAEFKDRGYSCSRPRVARLMRKHATWAWAGRLIDNSNPISVVCFSTELLLVGL